MTGRIQWTGEAPGTDPAFMGSVGTVDPSLFQIYAPDAFARQWILTTSFPGMEDKRSFADGPDDLKAEAERWLEQFVSSLGAAFPDEHASPPERQGKRRLGDADVLDSFRTVTNWSDAEVLHYESCGECDPFASVVCEASPLAVKLREAEETGQ